VFDLFDDGFHLLEEIKIKTEGNNREAFTTTLVESVGTLLRKASKLGLSVPIIGVGCAGSINTPKGTIKSAPNIPALEDYSIRKALLNTTDAEVVLSNDTNSALYGEHKIGAAIGCQHVIGIFVGTGIGGAMIIDGKLHT